MVDEHAKYNRHSRSDQLRVIVEDWLLDRTEERAIESTPPRHRQTPEEFIRGGRTLEEIDDDLYGLQLRTSRLVDTQAKYDAEAS